MQFHLADVVELFCIQILEQFADDPFDNVCGAKSGEHHGVYQRIGEFAELFDILPVLVCRKEIQIIFPVAGAKGWRTVALIFALIALAVNTFCVLMVKEVPDEDVSVETGGETGTSGEMDKSGNTEGAADGKVSFGMSLKLLLKNPYYIIILGLYLVNYIYSGITQGSAIYFMTYYMGDPALLGTFSLFQLVPVMIILTLTPMLVKKMGSMWKVNLYARVITLLMGCVFIFGAVNKNLPVMLFATFFRNMAGGPLTGSLNALVAETSDYTWRTQKVRIDGVMFSCSSIGVKLGGGIGSAVVGWLLAAGGFDGQAAVQSASAVNMIFFMYAVLPLAFGVVMAILVYLMKVEKANKEWDAKHLKGEAA